RLLPENGGNARIERCEVIRIARGGCMRQAGRSEPQEAAARFVDDLIGRAACAQQSADRAQRVRYLDLSSSARINRLYGLHIEITVPHCRSRKKLRGAPVQKRPRIRPRITPEPTTQFPELNRRSCSPGLD